MKINSNSLLKSLENLYDMIGIAPEGEIKEEVKNLECYVKIYVLLEHITEEKKRIYSKASNKEFRKDSPEKIKPLIELYNKLKIVTSYLEGLLSKSKKNFFLLSDELSKAEEYINSIYLEFLNLIK